MRPIIYEGIIATGRVVLVFLDPGGLRIKIKPIKGPDCLGCLRRK